MKQTAVEWLESKLKNVEYNPLEKNGYSNALERLYNQAKEMEKQQIIDTHFEGVKEIVLNLSEHFNMPKTLDYIQEIENGIGKHEKGEDYYNETFKIK
jgi:hypothetical protein